MPSRVLVVTDDDERSSDLVSALVSGPPAWQAVRVRTLEEAAGHLAEESPWAAVLADLELADGVPSDLAEWDGPILVMVPPDAGAAAGEEEVRRGAYDRVPLAPGVLSALPHLVASAVRQWARHARSRIAEDRLAHANRLIGTGRLAAVTAHEVGTPLNVARMQAQLLAAARDATPTVVAACDGIVEQIDLVSARLRAMLDYSRAGRARHEPLLLGEVVAQALDLLRPLAVRGGVELVVTGDPVVVRADRAQVQQVVFNLLNNALQVLPHGGHVRVHTCPETHHSEAFGVVTVHDDGPGIPPAIQAIVFDPFFTTKSAGLGTGLGLAVCEGIVHAHGGWIDLESSPEAGTRFRFGLPV